MKLYLLVVLGLWLSLWGFILPEASANALVISNVSHNLMTSTVTFNIGWQNSWRTTIGPANWDAAWVFIKFRPCGSDPTVEWTHGLINTSLSAHTFPTQLEPTTFLGVAPAIDPSPHNTGVMLRRTTPGLYPNAGMHTVTLNVTNLPAVGTLLDVKVIGIEMVFIPQGAFYVGDGTNSSWAGTFSRALISSEAAIGLWAGSGTDAVVNLNADYPKGFNAYYLMKYELTQGQYVEFLNTTTAQAQSIHYPGNGLGARYTLNTSGPFPNVYQCTRQDRAMNWMSWPDFSAYLDWAALRPMTELEFEKACRGQLPPIADEYAWGSRSITEATIISTTFPSENGTETILNPNANCNWLLNPSDLCFSGGDGSCGPLRVGIFATASSSGRQSSGAGYYGNMELSGNLWEYTVIASPTNGTTHSRMCGDGYLVNGNHNVTAWPAFNVAVVNNDGRIGVRGGSYENDWPSLRVSDRSNVRAGGHVTRYNAVGGRGAR